MVRTVWLVLLAPSSSRNALSIDHILFGPIGGYATMLNSATVRKIALAAAGCMMALSLAACGSDPLTRGVSGGLIGAGAGAGVSALTGGRPATGAAIGGGVGAVGGAVTGH